MLKIANNLTNEELLTLLNMTSERFYIYLGTLGNLQISTKISWVTLNGPTIQINTELADLSDMSDDVEIAEGLSSLKKKAKRA
jgi:hypothetical protein